MKKTSLLKTMLLLCALIIGSSSAWAEDKTATFDFDTNAGTDFGITGTSSSSSNAGDITSDVDATINGVTVTITPCSGANPNRFWENSPKLRLYGGTMTVSAGTNTIKSIALTVGSGKWSASVSPGSVSGSSTSYTWSGSASSIVFTITGNTQIKKMVVTYEEASSTDPSATLSTTSLAFGEVEVGKTKDLTFTVTPANLTGDLTIASNNSKYTVTPTSIAQTITTAMTITVKAAPTTLADDMDGTITISGGGLTSSKTVTLTASPYQVANVTLTGANGTFKVGDETVTSLTSRVGSTATIKAVPARGYSFTSWAAVGATPATSSNAETEFTFTAATVTLTATFTEITKYTVTLGDDNTELEEEYGGEGVELPSRNAVADYTFAGWSTTNIETETTTAPNGIISAGNYKPAANITLYPVYTRKETGGLVTHQVNIGEYASAHSWTTTSGGGPYLSVEIDDDVTVSVNSGNSNGKVYTNNNKVQWRVYSGGTLTFTATNNISSLTVYNNQSNDFGLKYGETALTNGTAIDVTPAKTIDLSVTATTRITDIDVVTSSSVTYYTSTPVITAPVTISTAEYATYCGARALTFNGAGITAFTATDNGDKVKLNKIENGQVPANTPVVLYKADADGTAINVPVIASADAVGDNDLNVSDGTAANDNMYVLANKTNGVGFYLWDNSNSNAIPEGKIYLQATSTARSFLGFEEGNTTSIDVRSKMEDVRGEVYNLNGQRVAQPTKGLYIVNGRKVVIK